MMAHIHLKKSKKHVVRNTNLKRNAICHCNIFTKPYQILVTFFNFFFLTFSQKLWFNYQLNLPPKFLIKFCSTPPQTRFHGNATKIEQMAIILQPLMLDANFIFSEYAEYPSSYLLSIHYISLTAQFFK